jgi:rubredoxin
MCQQTCTRLGSSHDHRWCPECQDEKQRYLEDQHELDVLAAGHAAFEAIPPANDEEYLAELDDRWPQVEDLAEIPMSMECPLCRGQKSIVIRRIPDDCPWCGGVGVVPALPEWEVPDLSDRRRIAS